MTSPYSSKAAKLSESLRHEVTVTAVPRQGNPFPLEIDGDSLSVTFDESWSPYAQGRLSAALPSPSSQLDRLDPRALCRIQIDAGYTFPDGERQVLPLANLGLKVRSVRRPDNVLELDAESDESLTQDYIWRYVNGMPTTGINEAVSYCLTKAFEWQTAPVIASSFAAGTQAADLTGLELAVGDSVWSMLDEIAARTGRRIYCDETRVWRIRPRPEYSGTPKHALTVGEAGTILTSATSLTRDGWYNNLTHVYDWEDVNGNPQRVFSWSEASGSALSPASVGYKALVLKFNKPITQAVADKVTATKLRNLISRGRSLQLTAIAAYWLRPGDTITVKLPTGDAELHLVQAVTFRPVSGLMDITTRQPFDVVITSGE